MTKQDKLLKYLNSRRFTTTDEVDFWGCLHRFTSAGRKARRFAEQGLIRRLTKNEKSEYFPFTKRQSVWVSKKYKRYEQGKEIK